MQALEQREVARLNYENCGREISLAFDTMNSNLSFAAGTLAALISLLGAGVLIGETKPGASAAANTGIPHLSSVSLVILSVALPLIWRFFIRATTGYQNLDRNNLIQKAAWTFLTEERSWAYFDLTVRIYFTRWRSPLTFPRAAWRNLKYGFLWIFAVLLAAIVWGFVSTDSQLARIVAGVVLVIGIGFEACTLRGYVRRYYEVPSEEDMYAMKSA
jgi:hypothetical protein